MTDFDGLWLYFLVFFHLWIGIKFYFLDKKSLTPYFLIKVYKLDYFNAALNYKSWKNFARVIEM